MVIEPAWTLYAALAANIATAVGVMLAFIQLRESRRIAAAQFEDGFTHQFREIS